MNDLKEGDIAIVTDAPINYKHLLGNRVQVLSIKGTYIDAIDLRGTQGDSYTGKELSFSTDYWTLTKECGDWDE